MSTHLNSSNGILQCGFCFQSIEANLNMHSVQPRSEGGADHESNLIQHMPSVIGYTIADQMGPTV